MPNKVDVKVLADIFDVILQSKAREDAVELKPLADWLKGYKSFKNPKDFNGGFIQNIIKSALEVAGIQDNVSSIWMNYGLFDEQVACFLESVEGSACMYDKSGWLLRQYVEYKKSGALPDMSPEEKCYWKPRFGTGQQWMNYIAGLGDMLYGKNQKWAAAIKALMEAHKTEKSGGVA